MPPPRGTGPDPPRGDRDQLQQRVELAQPSKGHRWGTRERRDVALPHAWVQLDAGPDPSAAGLVTSRN